MATPSSRPAPFRDILQVSVERIARLDDTDLNFLVSDLLRAHAYRCNGTVAEVRTNAEIKAGDEGCDAWTPAAKVKDEWFSDAPTCWQLKAGTAGEPAKLKGEITKPVPAETLRNGGRFVVIASGSKSGIKGERARIKKLRAEASQAGLPTDKIDALGAERLTNWCNEHPAVASSWAGRPPGLRRFDAWSEMEVHQTPWRSTPDTEASLARLRDRLNFRSGNLVHLHIHGPPGVGKSRFALELCRGAAWQTAVIYFSNGSDFGLREIIHSAVNEPTVELLVVADEIQRDQLTSLREDVDAGGGRVRLITIGHSDTPDERRIPAQRIEPLKPEQMRELVASWYEDMPRDYVDFVVQFSDGFIKLARLAADAVVRDPSVDIRQLLSLHGIQAFLDQMLGTEDNRKHLYVVAVLVAVGWTGELAIEGEAIAKHFGWSWNDVCVSVETFDRKFGIVPRGGQSRYISPKPLAIYLAVEAWNTLPNVLKQLPDILPTPGSIKAYDDRLRMISSNPQARQFSTEQLRLFFSIEHFADSRSITRWAAFAAANPALAAKSIARALEEQDVQSRLTIAGDARSTAVWTLVKLAWKPVAFHDAALALALLAEAENESWSNNATGEFKDRFVVDLGGTPVPYLHRLTVIDHIVRSRRTGLLKLAIAALAQVGNQHAHRTEIPTLDGERREAEWRPATVTEWLECVKQAVARLVNISSLGDPDLVPEFVAAADQLSMLLRHPETRPLVLQYYEAVRKVYPAAREPLRRAIETVLQRETNIWKELGPEELGELEVAHRGFEDSSLAARLQQYVGHATLIEADQPDLSPLVDELLSDVSLLATHWPWLTSGEAADVWRLGFGLGSQDESGRFQRVLGALTGRGPDLRLLSGYVVARTHKLGTGWFDEWITAEMRRDPHDFQLLFEIVARATPTAKAAELVRVALETGQVEPKSVGQLSYGNWSNNIPQDVLSRLLEAVAARGYEETALTILSQRLKNHHDELDAWDSFATGLVTLQKLICSRNMVNHYWEMVALQIAPHHPQELATAICAAQAQRGSGWFTEFSGAKKVILFLAKNHPLSVWEALKPHLTSRPAAHVFTIGFPRDVIDQVPPAEVLAWVAEDPDFRASIIAHMASKNFSTDDTLASRILGQFGMLDVVASAFFSNLISGVFGGPASSHWETLAQQLTDVSVRTQLPQLRRWADNSAASLRNMAELERSQEDEEQIRSG